MRVIWKRPVNADDTEEKRIACRNCAMRWDQAKAKQKKRGMHEMEEPKEDEEKQAGPKLKAVQFCTPGQASRPLDPHADTVGLGEEVDAEESQSLLSGAEERAGAALLARDKAHEDLRLAERAQRELQRELLDKVKETAAANLRLTGALAERDAAVNCVNLLCVLCVLTSLCTEWLGVIARTAKLQ